jgi:hypothetical protein
MDSTKLKGFIKDLPGRTMTFVTSPKFAAILGVGVAVFQLASAIDQLNSAAKGKKQIGFTNQKHSATDILARAFGHDNR